MGGELKPNRSAVPTRVSLPIFGPSGTKSALQDSANAWRKVPPQYSPLALLMNRPPTFTPLTTGKSSFSETTPFSSAAVVVTILKVEPGGWGAEKAWPARARTSPLRASRTAMPPERPPSAETAADWRRGSIVVFTGAPGFGGDWARTREALPESATARSEPPGFPARRALNAFSRPLTPTGV